MFLGVSSPNISTCAAGCSSWTVCVRITWCGSNSNPATRLTWRGIILAVIGLFAGCQSTDRRTFIDFMTYFYWGSSSMMIIFITWVMLVFVLYEIHFHTLLYLLHQKPSTCCIHTLKIMMHIWQMLHRAASSMGVCGFARTCTGYYIYIIIWNEVSHSRRCIRDIQRGPLVHSGGPCHKNKDLEGNHFIKVYLTGSFCNKSSGAAHAKLLLYVIDWSTYMQSITVYSCTVEPRAQAWRTGTIIRGAFPFRFISLLSLTGSQLH